MMCVCIFKNLMYEISQLWEISLTCWVACLNLSRFLWFDAADSGIESNDSDDEFHICEICTTEEVVFL